MPARNDITCDELKRFGLILQQPKAGYRFTLDPLLLCDFSGAQGQQTIADLGTGSGVMALVLARMATQAHITAFEHDAAAARLAQENTRLNGLADRVTVLHEDIMQVRRHLPVSSCDLVVSNPPYRQLGRGRLNQHPGRLTGRHEVTAGLADFLAAAKYLVKPEGRICLVYHPDRLPDLLVEAERQKLAVLRLRMVHGTPSAAAKVFLVELAKARGRGGLQVLAPLIVRDEVHTYSGEVGRILFGDGKSA